MAVSIVRVWRLVADIYWALRPRTASGKRAWSDLPHQPEADPSHRGAWDAGCDAHRLDERILHCEGDLCVWRQCRRWLSGFSPPGTVCPRLRTQRPPQKDCLSAYCVKVEDIPILGGADLRIRSLADRLQFFDPDDEALHLGISSAAWPLFGLLWPSARVLADALQSHDLRDMRILEIGCGLALPSLVAHRRHADVTASDRHPLTEAFLQENLRLNGLPPLRYRAGNWTVPDKALGKFDLIMGSDVLYERDQPGQLMDFIDAHGHPGVQVMLVDPDRGNRNAFSKAMTTLGFDHHHARVQGRLDGSAQFRGHMLNYQRAL